MEFQFKRCFKLVGIFSILMVFIYFLYTKTFDRDFLKKQFSFGDGRGIRHLIEEFILPNSSNTDEVRTFDPVLILFYTPVFGSYPWNEWYIGNIDKCSLLSNCSLTYNRSLFIESDLVVFHGRDLPSFEEMSHLHARRPLKQRWCFLVYESPINSPDLSRFDGMFNWTATYRKDSDAFWPYDYYINFKETKSIQDINYAKNKTKLVAIAYSNCVSYRRKTVLALLDLNISVDSYGACWGKPGRMCDADQCPYKFYLAFENSYCPDYITEKYWNALKRNMVPIVIGGANYSDPKIAIPGSFINALDFHSIKDLAEYLRYLDRNDSAYNQYFSWKELYFVGKSNDLSPVCTWCQLLSDPKTPSKIYKPIMDFWGRQLCQDINSILDNRLFS